MKRLTVGLLVGLIAVLMVTGVASASGGGARPPHNCAFNLLLC